MRGKRELLILIVIIAGLAAYLWTHNADRINYELPRIETLTTGKITMIEIKAPDETITLRRKDDAWTVGSRPYLANEQLVNTMLNAISGLQVSALASGSENYARYSLDEASAIRVTAWEGENPVRSFSVGKSASTQSNTFITLGDRPQIYLSEQNLRMTFDKSADMFRDKTVLSFSMDAVQSISIVKGSASLDLKKETQDEDSPKQPSWTDAKGHEIDAGNVQDLLRPLHALKCQNFIEDKDNEDVANPGLKITIHTEDTHTLKLFQEANHDEDAPLPGSSSDAWYPFRISPFNAEDIDSAVNTLLGIESPDPEGAAEPTEG